MTFWVKMGEVPIATLHATWDRAVILQPGRFELHPTQFLED